MGEVIYLYRRKGLSYWGTCDADQYMGLLERPLFEVKIARNDIDYADLEHEVDKLRAENAELVAALGRLSTPSGLTAYGEALANAIDVLAKHRGDTTQPTDKP